VLKGVEIKAKNAGNMKNYRKKPVRIQAILWDETLETLNILLNAGMFYGGYNRSSDGKTISSLTIRTLEGHMSAQKGDYIIKGIKGEFYPCKPDIFLATYNED
jgi:hypothetical protein